MAEKLKSTLRRIHWSSVLKAGVFVAAWVIFPFWLFALVALYLYFVPVPQSRTVAGPFFVLLLLMFLEPVGLLMAVIFAALFFYILLIKDLLLIDRKSAYEVTVLFLVFLLFRDFYIKEGASIDALSLFYSLAVAVIAGWLISNFIRFAAPPAATGAGASADTDAQHENMRRPAVWISTLLIWQFLIAGLFLPVDFVYQAVAVFLGSTLVIDLVPRHLFDDSSREKVLITSSLVFVLFVLVLGSARWGL